MGLGGLCGLGETGANPVRTLLARLWGLLLSLRLARLDWEE